MQERKGAAAQTKAVTWTEHQFPKLRATGSNPVGAATDFNRLGDVIGIEDVPVATK